MRLRVDYIRDGLIEETHSCTLCTGLQNDDDSPVYLRSCAKPLQASLLVDYNIDLTPAELALCSGSHAGEDCHIEVARGLLRKLKLDESYLMCGKHAPLSRTMQDKMLLRGEKYSEIHNNCSGKHLGFLAICRAKGWDLNNYYEPEHPLQIEIKKKIYELCGVYESDNYPATTDGCGVPIVSMPLKNILEGYRNLVHNYPQIVDAIINNSYIYGGEDRFDTEIIQKSSGIIAKVGAGGLCVVYNLKTDVGFVLKSDDASVAARRIAVLETLKRLKWADIEYDSSIKTLSGKIVGKINVTNLNI